MSIRELIESLLCETNIDEEVTASHILKAYGISDRKVGKWIRRELGVSSSGDDEVMVAYYVCSECGHANWIKEDNYCPNCGAEMSKGEDDDRSMPV